MNEDFESPGEEGNLKNENEFLKMKLMLEHGAEFDAMQTDSQIPVGLENEFLNYIMAYEKQAVERKMIKVFDRIKRPRHFKPVNELGDNEIDNAWDQLDNYLNQYNINLAVCSPNISKRELYRFTTEELFDYEMNDMNIPGMMTCFTYDEFYPDHKYDNTITAVDDCIKPILGKRPFEWMTYFRKEKLRLKKHFPLTQDEFRNLVNRFKQAYEDIELGEINELTCDIEQTCVVKGNYNVVAKLPADEIYLQGNWLVEFEHDKDLGYWYIVNVQIEGINF